MKNQLIGKHFLSCQDWSNEELDRLLSTAVLLKERFKREIPHLYLQHKTLFMIFFMLSMSLAAQEPPPIEEEGIEPPPWWEWRQATGDWGGIRSDWEDEGVVIELIYKGEVFSNLRGGLNTHKATEYRGNIDLSLSLDTEALRLWKGGGFFIYGQNGHGNGITERHVGDDGDRPWDARALLTWSPPATPEQETVDEDRK